MNPNERRVDVSRSGTIQTQLPRREEKQRNELAHTPLGSLLNMLNTAHVSDKTAQEGRERTKADKVDCDKNLNQVLSQHPQQADEGHIQEAFPWKKTVLKYL